MLGTDICERARLTRDARFDGRFFIGVKTTGIYCRPVCPVKPPKLQNVEFFPSAASASVAGYRPCLRCRPECAPGTPAWAGSSTTVRRGLRLIASSAHGENNVSNLAVRLGVSDRHLHRLFTKHLGAPPLAVVHTQRQHFAKRLIDDTSLPMSAVARAAGYGSVRRFNDEFRKCYGRTPSQLRRSRRNDVRKGAAAELIIQLPYRQPYDWQSLLDFMAMRATPGVEAVVGERYMRTIGTPEMPGLIEVAPGKRPGALAMSVRNVSAEHLFELVQTARDFFDLDAPIDEIGRFLGKDPALTPLVKRSPGLRVPGAWDGFELTVRAILGQQISVKAATTIAGRIAQRYGDPIDNSLAADGVNLNRLFPTAARLARARFNGLGLVGARAATIRRLASATMREDVIFDPSQDPDEFCENLTRIKGIGEWTAQYAAMRVLKHPDAFMDSDLGLLQAMGGNKRPAPKELQVRSQQWRPWRAYAALHLWNSLAGGGG